MEQWKDIKNYEGLYKISSYGRLLSLRGWNGHKYIYREMLLNPHLQKVTKNYFRYTNTLTKDRKSKSFRIHRLVAKAFIPNINNLKEINHIDSNPLNNNINNLEWISHRNNIIHSCKYGKRKTSYDEKNIIEDYISGMITKDVYTKYGITKSILYLILKKNSIKLKTKSDGQNKYKIPLTELLEDFKQGLRNVDLAKKYNANSGLIGVYKSKFKKEKLL